MNPIHMPYSDQQPGDEDPYIAYDWRVVHTIDGHPHNGAMGRTARLDRTKQRVIEALSQLPLGTAARAEIIRTHLFGEIPDVVLAIAHHDNGKKITWTNPS
jgi:hypothetical protein